jgi:coenzyme F420-reducing hydrogenase gamma subunit
MPASTLPKVAVYKFSSCDGCQLGLLNLEDDLLALVGEVEVAYFLEARSQIVRGPYDVALVEG